MKGGANLPRVSIIILNYDSSKLTIGCISSLSKIAYDSYEIILVDNGSKDKDIDFLQSQVLNLKSLNIRINLVLNQKNLGFAEGNNIGFKHAVGDLILFLNNDTVVGHKFLTPLVNKLNSDKSIAAVQPRILQYPRKNYIDSVGSYFLSSGFLYHYGHNKQDQKKYNCAAAIFSMKGACMLFKREALRKTGLFDKNYFAYFEETDLCQRVWLAGYKILYVPESVIYHEGGATSKKMDFAFINYHSYKNRIYTYLKNFELRTLIKIMPLHILLCELVSFIYLFILNFAGFFSIQRAILWNVVNFNQIIKARKKIGRLRKVKDVAYLSQITKSVKPDYYYHLFATSLAGYKDD